MSRKRARVTDENARAALGAGGLLAHIGEELADVSEVEVREVPIELIRPNPFQPRQTFDEEGLQELAASIREHGFYGHLLVRQQGRWYQLAYGERRLKAAEMAGFATVPVHVRELTDEQMLEISLTENVQREDLRPVDEARAYARLREELGYSVREIAARIGKSKSYVATLLSILRHPDVEQAVRTADIPVRTAEELAKIKDPEERRQLIGQVVAGELDRDGLIAARRQRDRVPVPPPVVEEPTIEAARGEAPAAMPATEYPPAPPPVVEGPTIEAARGEAPAAMPAIEYPPAPPGMEAVLSRIRTELTRIAELDDLGPREELVGLLHEIEALVARIKARLG